MNAIDHHSSPERPVAGAEVAGEEEVREQDDPAAEELRGRDADHVELLAGEREVAHEQPGRAVADGAG